MRVLIIDDDMDTRDTVAELLALEDFEVSAVADGRAGLESLTSFKPDVILLDAVMRDIDGRAFIQEQQRRPEVRAIPVVLTTGLPIERVRDFGARGVLTKPFTLDQLRDSILRAIAPEGAARHLAP